MFRKRLQLAFIHTAVAMTLVPLTGTLNRVMIFDFGLSSASTIEGKIKNSNKKSQNYRYRHTHSKVVSEYQVKKKTADW